MMKQFVMVLEYDNDFNAAELEEYIDQLLDEYVPEDCGGVRYFSSIDEAKEWENGPQETKED